MLPAYEQETAAPHYPSAFAGHDVEIVGVMKDLSAVDEIDRVVRKRDLLTDPLENPNRKTTTDQLNCSATDVVAAVRL